MGSLRRLAIVVALLAAACGAESRGSGRQANDARTPATATAVPAAGSHDECPITLPPQPGYVPPEPYPARPPQLYQAVWYGTADLWTMLSPEGEIWRDLPQHRGTFTQKTLWWAEDLSTNDAPTPLILTGRRLDRAGVFETGPSIGASFREDIGDFIVVGMEIPAAGCWELTARYGDSELSYVVLVDD